MDKFANLFRIAYHGGAFHGSQIQPEVKTVEGVVKDILKNLGASNPLFASRTDRGVNATCNFLTTVSGKECKEYVGEFIERLEEYPIWITGFSDVQIDFNPRIANEREYRYYIFNEKNKVLFNEVMQHFVGKHDFRNFARVLDDDIIDTRRTVKQINVISKGKIIMCEIRGLSFLWHQVRKMIGAACDVTNGRKKLIDIKKGLNGEKVDFTMAKAEFLTLSNIKYDNIEIEEVRNERIMRAKYELSISDKFFWKEFLH
tara:strand:+ start:70 stop:843 length:774 start_codon:yes stop_codon:yes gene_type:complete